ncbi:MAG: TRAP transporter substrate-binding protein [Desulfovibrionaceae bacterium]|nr:TRAP transporter substrate-binding protein [Desulfovibrionaceae bacterium]
MKRIFLGAAILAALCFLVNVSTADAARPMTLRLGHPMAPGNNVTLGYEKFAELVAEKSKGTIKIAIFGNAQIGNDRVTTEAAQAGTLDLTSSSTPNMASFHPYFMALDLPYVTNPKYQQNLYNALDNGELGKFYRELCNKIGLELLMFSEYGYRNFTSSTRSITKAADLKGMKVRTTDSPVEVAVAKCLGMNPAPIAWGETYTALQQGTVDGEGNTFSLLDAAKHSEVLKYAIDSRHNYSMHFLMMNKAKFDSLKPEQQKILREAAAEALVWQRGISPKLEKEAYDSFVAHGIKITHLTDADFDELYKLTQPVRDEFNKQIPAELTKMIADTQK